jgi:hypothetical protein
MALWRAAAVHGKACNLSRGRACAAAAALRQSPPMNQSQQEAIDRVFEILSEHFDHVVIAVGTYDEDKQYTTAASFTGGVAAAIGLCKLYEAKWTKEHLWGPDEYDQH